MKTPIFRPVLILKPSHVALPACDSAIRRFNEAVRATGGAEHYVAKHRAVERAEQLISINELSGCAVAGFVEAGTLDV